MPIYNFLGLYAPQEGFEPPANELTARRSTTELLRNGTGGENRTHLRLRVKQAASPEVDTGTLDLNKTSNLRLEKSLQSNCRFHIRWLHNPSLQRD